MSKNNDVNTVIEECGRCGEEVLSVYIEDGLCHQCRE